MRKFWQTEWFGIKFNSFIKLSPAVQANEEFYTKFYQEFFVKYKSYEELPEKWRHGKKQLAKFIYENIKNKKNILSIGCGIGYIENEILKFVILPKINTQ